MVGFFIHAKMYIYVFMRTQGLGMFENNRNQIRRKREKGARKGDNQSGGKLRVCELKVHNTSVKCF